MSKFKFQNQLNTIVEWYNQGKSYAEIARLLQSNNVIRDSQSVRNLLRKYLGDIKGHPKTVITEELKLKIHQYINEGKKPIEISKLLNIKHPTLGSYLQKQGIKFNPDPGNIHYFKDVDTYAKAYILGFIAADGAIVPSSKGTTLTLTITVKYEDKAVLEFIKSEIGNTHNLTEIRRPSGFNPNKEIHHIRLAISIPQLVKDVMKYGIEPRKSLTMGNIIRNIPFEFRDAFIIGYFDGDGSVTVKDGLHPNQRGIMVHDYSLYLQIRGTVPFFKGICEHLNITESHIKQGSSISKLCFANKKDVYRFYQCYTHLPFYYKRKHDRFLQRINHPSFDKYKQDQTISSPTK